MGAIRVSQDKRGQSPFSSNRAVTQQRGQSPLSIFILAGQSRSLTKKGPPPPSIVNLLQISTKITDSASLSTPAC